MAGIVRHLLPVAHRTPPHKSAVAETRQTLRAQGFKTDLADFNFSTTPELRAREADFAKRPAPTNRFCEPIIVSSESHATVGNKLDIVVWKEAVLK